MFESLASSGHKLIFGTSFGYMNYMVKVAGAHPDVMFEHCTGYKDAANLATYNIRFYQGRYVQGVIAGKMSKAGLAGYVGSVPVPEVDECVFVGDAECEPGFQAEVYYDRFVV